MWRIRSCNENFVCRNVHFIVFHLRCFLAYDNNIGYSFSFFYNFLIVFMATSLLVRVVTSHIPSFILRHAWAIKLLYDASGIKKCRQLVNSFVPHFWNTSASCAQNEGSKNEARVIHPLYK